MTVLGSFLCHLDDERIYYSGSTRVIVLMRPTEVSGGVVDGLRDPGHGRLFIDIARDPDAELFDSAAPQELRDIVGGPRGGRSLVVVR